MKYHVSKIILDAFGEGYVYREGNLTFYKKSSKWWKSNTPVAVLHISYIVLMDVDLASRIEQALKKYNSTLEVMVSSYLF